MTEELPQGFDEFEFSDSTLGGGDSAPEAFGSSLQDEFGARRLLDPLLVDPAEMNRLRRAYSANHPYADLSGISDADLIDTLTARPAQDIWGLDFLGRTSRPPIFSGSGEQRPEEAASVGTSEPDTVAATKPWIKFRVVWDGDGAPIPNVALMVEAPDGSSEEHTTNAEGIIDIEKAESGEYAVFCDRKRWRLSQTLDFVKAQASSETPAPPPGAKNGGGEKPGPSRILEVIEHKVRGGESIKSIADANGMTWQQLSLFNWDTAVPDEINEHLRDDVGCTVKTADGNNYRFSDGDDPGIVYLPGEWRKSGLEREMTHTFRVKGQPVSVWVRLDIDPEDADSHDDKFVLKSADGSYKSEKTVKDDRVPGDHFLDLLFTGLSRGAKYSLEFIAEEGAEAELVFENVSYDELDGISTSAPAEELEEGEDDTLYYPDDEEEYGEEYDEEEEPPPPDYEEPPPEEPPPDEPPPDEEPPPPQGQGSYMN